MITREKIIHNRIIHISDFWGKRYTPSFPIRSYFLKFFMLVYSDFGKKFLIQNLTWDTDYFRITLCHQETSEIFEFFLQDNTGIQACGGKLCTSNLCTGMHNQINNKDFLTFLVGFREKGASITIGSLLKFLIKDPKAKKEYYRIFTKPERPPFSIIQDWGHPLHRMRFIAHEGVFRNVSQSLSINVPNIDIQHSERECLGIGPEIPYHREYKFFNFPMEYYDHTYDKFFYLSSEERTEFIDIPSEKGLDAFTDLDEEDIIMGKGMEKLQNTLDSVVERIEKEDIKMLSFNCCCVPRIVGDDIISVLERMKKKISIPFIFQGQLEKTPFEQNIALIESYLSLIDANLIEQEEGSLILFGYHENKYLKLLSDTLILSDIRIRAMFIPMIDIQLLSMLYRSSLFVFSSNRFQEEIFEYPFRVIGTSSITPVYPYSIENTKQWFESIYESFGKTYIPTDKEVGLMATFDIYKNTIKKNRYSVGVVCIGKSELLRFLDPDYMNNVNIISCLKEMGFNIHFFIYTAFDAYEMKNNEKKFNKDEGDTDIINSILSEKMQGSTYTVSFFSEELSMYKSVAESGVRSIYSDIYYDDRIARIGLTQFNIRQFYIGYQGAVDSIQEMIRLCEMKYFDVLQKYAK